MNVMTLDRGTWLESEIMKDDELLRRFLLGELEGEEAQGLEARLLEEDELFELSEAIEAELLDALARGGLAPAERDRVRKRLASSRQGRARLALARGLAAWADGKRSPGPAPLPFPPRPALAARPAVRWAIAAGLLVLLGGAGIWILNRPQGEGQIAQREAVREPGDRTSPGGTAPLPPAPPAREPGVEETPSQTEPGAAPTSPEPDLEEVTPEPAPRAEPEPEVFVLSLLTRRQTEKPEEIRIPSGKEHIALHVDVTDEDFQTYDAVVKRGGEEILKSSHFAPRRMDGGHVLVLDLQASDLPFGRYVVEVYGNSADGTRELVKTGEIEVADGG
jgi:hypothetical protein